jgi:hypothetical protein
MSVETKSVETKNTEAEDWSLEVKEDDKSRKMNWAFTWNNYTEDDIKSITEEWIKKMPDMRCVVFGREIAPTTGTPHLQGLFVYSKLKSFKQVKEMMPKEVRFSQMRKPLEANLRYCEKDGKFTRVGDVPMSQKEKGSHGHKGKESGKEAADVWALFVDAIKDGMSRKELMETFPEIGLRCSAGFDRYFDMFRPQVPFNIEKTHESFYPWQRQLLDIIDLKADSRSVIWVYSARGNTGKTSMFKHLICMDESFEPFMNAPTRDLSCAWKGGSAIFDLARDDGGVPMNYSFMEMIKNGYAFSAKYESKCKKASNMMKERFVICFSNSRPDILKLSIDRWAIFNITEELTLDWEDP